jgi:hypothetical protein
MKRDTKETYAAQGRVGGLPSCMGTGMQLFNCVRAPPPAWYCQLSVQTPGQIVKCTQFHSQSAVALVRRCFSGVFIQNDKGS